MPKVYKSVSIIVLLLITVSCSLIIPFISDTEEPLPPKQGDALFFGVVQSGDPNGSIWIPGMFMCKALPGADSYTLEISNSDAFSTTIEAITQDSPVFQVENYHLSEGTWYYRFTAHFENDVVQVSPVVSFTVVPAEFGPIKPPSGNLVSVPLPDINWDPIEDAYFYEIQLSGNIDNLDTRDFIISREPEIPFNPDLDFSRDYIWRIRAVAEDGSRSMWSPAFSFTLDSFPLTWQLYFEWSGSVSSNSSSVIVTLQQNGLFSTDEGFTGRWTMENNSVSFTYDSGTAYTGSVRTNLSRMSGTMTSFDNYPGNWFAVPVPVYQTIQQDWDLYYDWDGPVNESSPKTSLSLYRDGSFSTDSGTTGIWTRQGRTFEMVYDDTGTKYSGTFSADSKVIFGSMYSGLDQSSGTWKAVYGNSDF